MLRIADKYQVLDVVDLVKGRIATVEITSEGVVTAASIAEQYKNLLNFEDVSEGLTRRSAAALHDNSLNVMELSKFMSSHKDNQELVTSLINKGIWN